MEQEILEKSVPEELKRATNQALLQHHLEEEKKERPNIRREEAAGTKSSSTSDSVVHNRTWDPKIQ